MGKVLFWWHNYWYRYGMLKKITLSLLTLVSLTAMRADIFDTVVQTLKSGQAKEVAKYFNTNVALTMLNDEGIYSKQQAEVIMKNFFSQNPPKNVTIQHRGASAGGAKFAVAIYECAQGNFRAYIFMKDAGNGMLIHELRIEKD
jgi:hypothetical protein